MVNKKGKSNIDVYLSTSTYMVTNLAPLANKLGQYWYYLGNGLSRRTELDATFSPKKKEKEKMDTMAIVMLLKQI